MKFLDVLKVFGPAILGAIPKAQPYAGLILAGMQIAEESGVKGADKKVIAIKVTKLGAATANQIAGHTVVSADKAVDVAHSVIDLVVGSVNKHVDKAVLLPTVAK